MNVHGWCEKCRKVKRVKVTGMTSLSNGRSVAVGTCQTCEEKIQHRRDEAGELTIFVPRDPGFVAVARGSAIVGRDEPIPGKVEVYYEGDIYQRGMPFEEMLLHAADRLVAHYPTIARAWVDRLDLIPVGTYDYGDHRAIITDPIALDIWRN